MPNKRWPVVVTVIPADENLYSEQEWEGKYDAPTSARAAIKALEQYDDPEIWIHNVHVGPPRDLP